MLFQRSKLMAIMVLVSVFGLTSLLEPGIAKAQNKTQASKDVMVLPKPAGLKRGNWNFLPANAQQSTYTYTYLEKNKNVVGLIKKIKPDFNLRDVGTADAVKIAKTTDGREFVVMWGCVPHDCGGNITIIAYNRSEEKAYLLSESFSPGKLALFGKPDETVVNILLYSFASW